MKRRFSEERRLWQKGASVADRRQIVAELIKRGLSERETCLLVGISRSRYRYKAASKRHEDHLKERIENMGVSTENSKKIVGENASKLLNIE